MPGIAGNGAHQAILELRKVLFPEDRRKGTHPEEIAVLLRSIPVHCQQSGFLRIDTLTRIGKTHADQHPFVIGPSEPGDDIFLVVRCDDAMRILPRDRLGIQIGLSLVVAKHGQVPTRGRELDGGDAGK